MSDYIQMPCFTVTQSQGKRKQHTIIYKKKKSNEDEKMMNKCIMKNKIWFKEKSVIEGLPAL